MYRVFARHPNQGRENHWRHRQRFYASKLQQPRHTPESVSGWQEHSVSSDQAKQQSLDAGWIRSTGLARRLPGNDALVTVAGRVEDWRGVPKVSPSLLLPVSLPPPPKCFAASVSCDAPCCLRPTSEGSAFGLQYFRGHMGSLALRPGNSLTIHQMALLIGFR